MTCKSVHNYYYTDFKGQWESQIPENTVTFQKTVDRYDAQQPFKRLIQSLIILKTQTGVW